MRDCPDGGTGIRARLKIVSRKGCGFDPHSGHPEKNIRHEAPIAQLVEQLPLKEMVVGSIPTGCTALRNICPAADVLAVQDRSYVFSPEKTSEVGSGNFVSDGEQNILDHKYTLQIL